MIALASWPARADDDFTVEGVVMDSGADGLSSSVHLSGLYPSATRTAVIFFDGAKAGSVRAVQVAADGLEDRENACNHPESTSGDTSCASDEGELSRWLTVSVSAGREVPGGSRSCQVDAATRVQRTLGHLAATPLDVRAPGDGTAAVCLLVAFRHDEGRDDNVTQTDGVSFDLDIGLTELVLAETATRPGQAPPAVDDPSPVVTPTHFDAGLAWGPLPDEPGLGSTGMISGASLLSASMVLLGVAAQRTRRRPADVGPTS